MIDENDKNNIFLISILFLIVIIISIYVSSTRVSTHSFLKDYYDYSNLSYPEFNSTFFENVNDDNCTFCEDKNVTKLINQKIEDSGLAEFFEMDDSQPPIFAEDLPSMQNLNENSNKTCTPIFNFKDSVHYSKNYRYTFTNDNSFYVNEKYKGKLNEFYVVETTSKILFSSQTYSTVVTTYYDENGKCVYSEYSTDLSPTPKAISCTNNYETFLCEEIINTLNFKGEEKYYVYANNYDVLVYANEDNSTIFKYGKTIPVLFYMENIDENNKLLKIELLNVEG